MAGRSSVTGSVAARSKRKAVLEYSVAVMGDRYMALYDDVLKSVKTGGSLGQDVHSGVSI